MRRAAIVLATAILIAGCGDAGQPRRPPAPAPSPTPAGASARTLTPAAGVVRHVFVLVLENQGFDASFGPDSQAPYLARELTGSGQLLTQYYGIGHNSLDNYIALVSGQAPNPDTEADCHVFADFTGPGRSAPGDQLVGRGCVYPHEVQTVADQLTAAKLSWKGYMDGMGRPCRHPAIGAPDDTARARVVDQYATKHNPFVYFHSIIDTPACARGDVPLDALAADLARAGTTPNLAFITPDLCDDGHDRPCVDGRPGGLRSADAFLRTWVPRITGSPAFRRDGMLVVTFDEAARLAGGDVAATCCGQQRGPNVPGPGNPGGGRVGAVVLSPFVRAGSQNATPYNHYALLRTIEDVFGLPHLGYAGQAGLRAFGADVLGSAAQR